MSALPWPAAAAQADERFGGLDALRYGFLGLPLAFLTVPLYVLLPIHYGERHGVTLSTLGAVLLLTRVADGLADPFIGVAVDRLFARSLRAVKAVAAAAAVLVGAGFWALFFAPLQGGALVLWLAAWLMLSYLAFSALTIVHQAWGVRLGGDAARRARIVGARELAGIVGVVTASVLPATLGLRSSALLLSAALLAGVLLLAFAPTPSAHAVLAPAGWQAPWRDGRFRRLLAVFMLNGIASAIPATLVLFFVRDRLQLPQAAPWFLAAYFLAAALSIPGWPRVVRRFGLARAWWAGMLLAVAAFAWAFGLAPGEAAGFVAVCIASGIALGADLTLPGALLSGLVQRSPQAAQAQGVYVGWWNSATKLNLGLAAGLGLPLLSAAGYAPGRQDPAALQALAVGYVLVPCVLKLLAAGLLWRWWLLTKESE